MSHTGMAPHRLKSNPLEKRFHDKWREMQLHGTTLAYLMGDGSRRAPLSERDELVAATVIQWLGSPVGQSFLRDVLDLDLSLSPPSESAKDRVFKVAQRYFKDPATTDEMLIRELRAAIGGSSRKGPS